MRRWWLLVPAAAGVTVLAACGNQDLSAARLGASVGPTFARLYTVQQGDLGPSGSGVVPDGKAICYRGAPLTSAPSDPNAGAAAAPSVTVSGPQSGAGDDWTCVVNYPFPDGHIQPIAYDLTVQATGCYTADGPTAVVGQQRISTADGRTVTNPLFAFDGCLDLG